MRFTSYAQNFEDVMLWRALGDVTNGFYIDVGAADPVDLSVTQAFHERHWRGMNIEPARHYFSRLQAARPDDINLNIAIGDAPGSRIFYEIGDSGLSTLDQEVAAAHRAAGWPVQRREVEAATLAEVCARYAPAEIHFLKIDVEGAEGEVLAGADFKTFRPWIVLLEATRPMTTEAAADWEPIILAADYVFVWFDGLNRFYVSRECQARLQPHFQVPPNYFDDFDKYDFELQTWRARQQEERRARRDTERHLEGRLNEVKLLEAERLLRRRRQQQAAAELARERESAAVDRQDLQDARQALAEAQRAMRDADHAQRQDRHHREVVTRLAYDLRWDAGPRALRLVLPLARVARKLFGGNRPTLLDEPRAAAPAAIAAPAPPPSVDAKPPAFVAPRTSAAPSRNAVHQFHPGSSYGDAVTNSMLLTQRVLRGLGYRSEIYVEYRDEALADQLLLLDDLPEHDDYVLIVLHSLGYGQTARIAALPAPKILMYHNITPAHFLRDIPVMATLAEQGRAELDFWRPRVVTALTVSPYNAIELRQHGYEGVGICPMLFDVDELRSRVRPRKHDAEDPFTILFVGRIVENKGQIDLVDAFDAFRRRYKKPCQLVLVGRFEGGGGNYIEAVFDRITDHGLRQMVRITGQVSDDELASWYNRADLYVSLSQHEGFGVPLIEAMAYDLPVIAYAAGAVPFTMNAHGRDPDTVLFSREPASVAEAMLAIATDPLLRADIIRENRKNLDRFELSRHIPTLVQALLRCGAQQPVDAEMKQELIRHLNFAVTGHFSGSYSLAAVNRTLALALEHAHKGHVRITPIDNGAPGSDLTEVPATEIARLQRLIIAPIPATGPIVVISQHYPVFVPDLAAAPGLLAAYFFWEESLVPAATIAVLNSSFQIVLAPSRFVAKVLVDSGLRIPVRVVGYAPPLARFARLGDQKRLRRCGEPFVFLHVSSTFPRKGVDVLLGAFAEAFPAVDADRPVRLVIKTFANPQNQTAAQIADLRKRHASLPDIVLIERDLTEDELLALYRDADAVVLPTRGEGFNVPAAEAVAAGLPLITTGAGGHIDFLGAQDAVLLPWQMRHSRSHLNSGFSLWYEPDEAALAAAMRAMFDDLTTGGGKAEARAAVARQAVMARLDSSAWTRRVADAVADIQLAKRPRPLRLAWLSSWDVRCGVAEYTRHQIAGFEPLLAPEDQLLMLCDNRTPPRQSGRLKVVPAWHGNCEDVDRLAGVINREDPDVLMIQHQPGLIGWAALVTLLQDPRMRPRVVLVTLHTTLQLGDLAAPDRVAVIDALRQVARVIVHTVADVNFLHGLDLFENVVMIPQGTSTMPNAARPARRLAATDSPLIGCYGFLLPPKGLRQLIGSLPELQKTWPDARLRLVNALHTAPESAIELAACQALAGSLGVSSSIEWFTEFLPHEESMALLGDCDLVVLPYAQTKESSSAALRSCLASGAPLAVSLVKIFDEAEDAVCRIDAGSSASLAEGITNLLADAQARQGLQDAAKSWMAPRSWSVVARQVHGMAAGLVIGNAFDRTQEIFANPATSEGSSVSGAGHKNAECVA